MHDSGKVSFVKIGVWKQFVVLILLFSLLVVTGSAIDTAYCPSGMVSYWEANGTASDSYGANNGTLMNGAGFASGRIGQGFSLDGIDDYVSIDAGTGLGLDKLSVEFWFKPDRDYGLNDTHVTLVKHDDYEVYISNGKIAFDYFGGVVFSVNDTWNLGQWYHVVAGYDGAVQSVHVNGAVEVNSTVQGPFIVESSGGESVASFLNSGEIVLNGSCSVGGCSNPVDPPFAVQNPSGTVVSYIDGSGNMCVELGDCTGNDISCGDAGDGSFKVANKRGVIVSYINATGGLCSLGPVTENGDP